MAKRLRLFSESIWKEVNSESKELLEDYLLELKSQGKSEKTIYQYKADIRGFYCWTVENADNKSILKLKKRTFRQFFIWMKDHGTSAARVNRFQSSIRNLLAFAEQEEDDWDYDRNAMSTIKGMQGEKVREIFFLTDDQVKLIYDYLIEKEEYQKALYLALSYDSAGRRNEVAQVKKTDFLTKNQTNEVIGKRGKKFKLVYFSRSKEAAKLWLEKRGEDNFDSMWMKRDLSEPVDAYGAMYHWTMEFRDILEELTGDHIEFNPHSFRHSSLESFSNGTHYVLKEMNKDKLDINALKVLANHSDISTTQSYLMDRDAEILGEALGLELE